jgi:hypothetical protein
MLSVGQLHSSSDYLIIRAELFQMVYIFSGFRPLNCHSEELWFGVVIFDNRHRFASNFVTPESQQLEVTTFRVMEIEIFAEDRERSLWFDLSTNYSTI